MHCVLEANEGKLYCGSPRKGRWQSCSEMCLFDLPSSKSVACDSTRFTLSFKLVRLRRQSAFP